jgi:hypothetical protein
MNQNTYEITETKLATLLETVSESAASKVLVKLGLQKSQISQREAFRRFGEGRVMRWRLDGKIKPNKSGGKIYYSLDDLEKLKGINEFYTGKNRSEFEK